VRACCHQSRGLRALPGESNGERERQRNRAHELCVSAVLLSRLRIEFFYYPLKKFHFTLGKNRTKKKSGEKVRNTEEQLLEPSLRLCSPRARASRVSPLLALAVGRRLTKARNNT
jgi:hypothetical protein